MQFYGPDDKDGRWSDEPSVRVRDVVEGNFNDT